MYWSSFHKEKAKTWRGYPRIVYSSSHGEFSASLWGSCGKWQLSRFKSSRMSNTCHYSFTPQLSKCWLLHGEMRCAIKANLSLYSRVNPAMFNQLRSRRAPGRRDESREAPIRTQSEGRHTIIQYENSNTEHIWFLTLESEVLKSLCIQLQSYQREAMSLDRPVELFMLGTGNSITLIWLQTTYMCFLLWAEKAAVEWRSSSSR